MSDKFTASEVPITPKVSISMSPSDEKILHMTWTSFLNPSGNIGLIGLSIILALNISLFEGLASLLINPPGIFPEAYIFSLYSTVSGKKSYPTAACFCPHTVTRSMLSPYFTTADPLACLASLPDSRISSLPPSIIFFEKNIVTPVYVIYSFHSYNL